MLVAGHDVQLSAYIVHQLYTEQKRPARSGQHQIRGNSAKGSQNNITNLRYNWKFSATVLLRVHLEAEEKNIKNFSLELYCRL